MQGLGCYDGLDVMLVRDPLAGGLTQHFLAGYQRPCALLLASQQPRDAHAPALANSQPYTRELLGHAHLFALQGVLQGLDDGRKYPTGHYLPIGQTCAEHAFCVLMSRMLALWQDGKPLPEVRLAVVTDFAARMRPLGLANFLYSDGELLFAHGQGNPDDPSGPGLYLCGGDGEIRVASTPQSDGDWTPLAAGEVVMIRSGEVLERVPPVILWSQRKDG